MANRAEFVAFVGQLVLYATVEPSTIKLHVFPPLVYATKCQFPSLRSTVSFSAISGGLFLNTAPCVLLLLISTFHQCFGSAVIVLSFLIMSVSLLFTPGACLIKNDIEKSYGNRMSG